MMKLRVIKGTSVAGVAFNACWTSDIRLLCWIVCKESQLRQRISLQWSTIPKPVSLEFD